MRRPSATCSSARRRSSFALWDALTAEFSVWESPCLGLLLRGSWHLWRFSHADVIEAQVQFRRAIEIDPKLWSKLCSTFVRPAPSIQSLRPDVPIIMITAYGDAETKRQALERGAEALLTKPIDFGTLRSEIDIRVERAA